MSSFSAFISRRQTLAYGNPDKDRNGGSKKPRRSPAVAVAIGGVALSVTVMLISLAVVTGFKSQIRDKIIGFDSQITISPLTSYYHGEKDSPILVEKALTDLIDNAIKKWPGASAEPEAAEGGILKTSEDFLGVGFRSIPLAEVGRRFIEDNITEGAIPDPTDANPRDLIISNAIADKLNLKLGDKTDAYFITDAGGVRPRKFEVKAIYCTNFGEYDNTIVYAPYSTISRLAGAGEGEAPTLKISGLPLEEIPAAAMELQSALNRAYTSGKISQHLEVTTVLSTGAMYFNWLDLLDTNVIVILALMACVSGFMLISCVLILILQRVRMIGILKALGATDRQISGIFIRLGMRVTLLGLAIGNILSIIIIFIQKYWKIIPLDPEAYYLTHVPVEPQVGSWLLLNGAVALLCLAVLIIPSAVISRLSPLRAINFE